MDKKVPVQVANYKSYLLMTATVHHKEKVTLTILISPSLCLILWMLISALHYLLLYVTAQNPHPINSQ